jgi:hypothetical protein
MDKVVTDLQAVFQNVSFMRKKENLQRMKDSTDLTGISEVSFGNDLIIFFGIDSSFVIKPFPSL